MGFLTPSPPPDASPSRRGLVSTLAQAFGGLKSFVDGIRAGSIIGPVSNEATDIGAAGNRFGEVHAAEVLTDAVTFPGGGSQSHAAPTLAAGAGISVVEAGGVATIAATQFQKTLVAGQGIQVAEGPSDFTIAHKLVGGNGITLTDDAGTKETTISTPTVTLANAGTGTSLVTDGTGPILTLRSIEVAAESGLVLSVSGARIIVSQEDTGLLDCPFPSYVVERRTRLFDTDPWGDWLPWDTRTFWRVHNGDRFRVRRQGKKSTLGGIVQRSGDSAVLPGNGPTVEYRWAGSDNPHRWLCTWPTGAGVLYPQGSNFRFGYASNADVLSSGLRAYSGGVMFESIPTLTENQWVGVGVSWGVA